METGYGSEDGDADDEREVWGVDHACGVHVPDDVRRDVVNGDGGVDLLGGFL